MVCERVEREETIEKYLAGTLGQAELEAFEEHCFACSPCFEELEFQRTLQAELRESEKEIRDEALPARPAWRWTWVTAAATAVVILAVGLLVWRSAPQIGPPVAVAPPPTQQPVAPEVEPEVPPSQPEPSLAELARVEPPVYVATVLRRPTDEATRQFRQAMQHYVAGDHAAAIPGLRAASDLEPGAPNINFFLGICYLLTDETDEAIAALQKTVSRGDSRFLEKAHFYSAKTYLRQGNLSAAEESLENAIQLGGELQAEAQELLSHVRGLQRNPH
jgi:tetratricopeptide (TPR) repeat protein